MRIEQDGSLGGKNVVLQYKASETPINSGGKFELNSEIPLCIPMNCPSDTIEESVSVFLDNLTFQIFVRRHHRHNYQNTTHYLVPCIKPIHSQVASSTVDQEYTAHHHNACQQLVLPE